MLTVFQAPKSVLVHVSDRLAKEVDKACREATAKGEWPATSNSDPESIAFPELLYWAYKHELPLECTDDDSEAPFMSLWLLAGHYALPVCKTT